MYNFNSIEKIIEKKIYILEVLKFFKIPFVLGFSKARMKAVWRGNKKNSVQIDLNLNYFCDFGDNKNSGGVLKLYYYLKGYIDDFYEIKNDIIIDFIKDFKLDNVLNMDSEKMNLYLKELEKRKKNFIIEQDKITEKQIKIQIFNINKKYHQIAIPAIDFQYLTDKKIKGNNLSGQLKNIFFKNDVLDMFLNKKLNSQQIYDYKFNKALIMPVFNIETKELISLQYFYNKETLEQLKELYNKEYYNKEFHYNTITKNGCFILNKNKMLNEYNQNINAQKIVFICEGLATGLTIFNLLNEEYSVVIALNSFGIKNIVEILNKQYENLKIIIISDRDQPKINVNNNIISNLGAGLEISLKLKEKYNNIIVFSPILHIRDDKSIIIYNEETKEFLFNNPAFWNIKNKFISDFNDLYFFYGKHACMFNLTLNLLLNKSKNFVLPELKIYYYKARILLDNINKIKLFSNYNYISKKIIINSKNVFLNNKNNYEVIINDFYKEEKKELILNIINNFFI